MKLGIAAIAAVLGVAAIAFTFAGSARDARAADAAEAKAAPPAALRSCSGCHDVVGGKKRIAVSLVGLYGAKPVKAGIKADKWDDETLEAFLADPAAVDPTSKMKVKTKDAKKRADVIAAMKALKK